MGSEFKYRQLKDCASWYSGGTPRKSIPEYWDGDIPWISAKSLSGTFISTSDDKVTELGAINGSRLLPTNSILFVVRGMSLKSEFRVGITTQEVTFNQDLKALIAVDDIDPYYLMYTLKSKSLEVLGLVEEAGHGTGVLPTSVIQKLEIPVPSLSIQKAIADAILNFDNKITLNRQINQTLEQMAQTLFKSWFVDFDPVIDNALDAGNAIPDELQARAEQRQALRHAVNEANAENQPHSTRTNPVASDGLASPYKSLPDDIRQLFPNEFEESELGWVPKGWGVDELQSIAPLTNKSITPNRKPDELWEHYSIPAFDGGKIPSFDQGEMIKSGKYIVPENSILVSKLNPTTKRVWMPMIKNSFLSVCSTEFMPFVPNNAVVRNFLYCLLSSDNVQTMICNRVTGTTGSRQRAQPKEVAAMRLLLPTVDLMEVFSNKVAPHLLRVLKGRDENQTLTKLRDTLLPKLISGELRLDEVESTIAETTTA